jgi:hypothetical protein
VLVLIVNGACASKHGPCGGGAVVHSIVNVDADGLLRRCSRP